MGKRGPAPKPTQLRLLHGDKPSRINHDEPIPPDLPLVCPPDASDEVRQVWDHALTNLIAMGVATSADRDALRCYCEAVVIHRRACALLADGTLLKTESDSPVTNPAVRIQRDAASTIKLFAREFGFTPSARSEIHKGAASNAPSAARYLNG